MLKRRLAWMGVMLLAGSGCALTYHADPQFQNWLSQAEDRCIPRYGALPIQTDEQRNQFLNLSYQVYYDNLPKEAYANQLQMLYSNSGLTVNCLANAIPRR